MGPEISSNAGAGVWRTDLVPDEIIPDSDSVLDLAVSKLGAL